MTLGEAETSLERFLAEPLRDRGYAADAMLLVTYVRRLGTALTSVDTLAFDMAHRTPSTADKVARLDTYVAEALRAAKAFVRDTPGGGAARAGPPIRVDPETPFEDALERVLRWAALVASAAGVKTTPNDAATAAGTS
jgi:hypothetical protein